MAHIKFKILQTCLQRTIVATNNAALFKSRYQVQYSHNIDNMHWESKCFHMNLYCISIIGSSLLHYSYFFAMIGKIITCLLSTATIFFSLATLRFSSFSFTRVMKSCLHLEWFTCSMRMLILLEVAISVPFGFNLKWTGE